MQDDRPGSSNPGSQALPQSGSRTLRRISSAQLFAGARELVIEHDGRLYQLRITQNGKLILTA
jgi:hemin uptake protein HemP